MLKKLERKVSETEKKENDKIDSNDASPSARFRQSPAGRHCPSHIIFGTRDKSIAHICEIGGSGNFYLNHRHLSTISSTKW